MLENKKFLIIIISIVLFSGASKAQEAGGRIIDGVIAVVGDHPIMKSELESKLLQQQARGGGQSKSRSKIFEDLLFQKLLLNQADIDSVEASERRVNRALDRRIQTFIQRIGSRKKLENYFNKSISGIKDEFREDVRRQLRIQKVQQNITGEVKVSPSEVKKFFNNLPTDSIPRIPKQYRVAEIMIHPPISNKQKRQVRNRLNEIRERIIDEGNFEAMATLYSDDDNTAQNGGDMGFVTRENLVSEFAAVAFNLTEGEISRVVETNYGFHIIKMVERQGERIHVKQILMKPDITPKIRTKAKNKLDSIKTLINTDTLSFAEAARKFSESKRSRLNGGVKSNPKTGKSKFQKKELSPQINGQITQLEEGEISPPFESTDDEGNTIFKIIQLKDEEDAHTAKLSTDYQRIKQMAVRKKNSKLIEEWVKEKMGSTYVKIDKEYQDIDFQYKDWIK